MNTKSIFPLIILFSLILMGCSKSNKNQIQEDTIDEDMPRLMLVNSTDIKGNTGFRGFILATQDGRDVYLYDDEQNYDNAVYSVYLALILGDNLYSWAYIQNNAPSMSFDEIGKYAMFMENMPLSREDRKKNGISEEIYEIMAKCYYDHKDVQFYAPTRKYGFVRYPYEYSSFGYENSVEICRVTDHTRETIGYTLNLEDCPNGAAYVRLSSRWVN